MFLCSVSVSVATDLFCNITEPYSSATDMHAEEIIAALTGIVNTTSLSSLPVKDKVRIRAMLNIIEYNITTR